MVLFSVVVESGSSSPEDSDEEYILQRPTSVHSDTDTDTDTDSDCIAIEETPKRKVMRKKRWSHSELEVFNKHLLPYITKKQRPPLGVYIKVSKLLPCRSIPMLRTRVHNILSGKQSM